MKSLGIPVIVSALLLFGCSSTQTPQHLSKLRNRS